MLSKTSQLRFFPGMLLLLILLALLTGCGGSPGESPGNSLRIAVIPKGTTHDFWKMVHAGAIKAEREINSSGARKVEIIWKGPLKEDNTEQQINLVRTFVSRKVDGIVLAPLDSVIVLEPLVILLSPLVDSAIPTTLRSMKMANSSPSIPTWNGTPALLGIALPGSAMQSTAVSSVGEMVPASFLHTTPTPCRPWWTLALVHPLA